MSRLALLLVSLLSSGVSAEAKKSPSQSLQSLARLLQAHEPATAFQAAGLGHGSRFAMKSASSRTRHSKVSMEAEDASTTTKVTKPLAPNRISQRAPETNMIVSEVKDFVTEDVEDELQKTLNDFVFLLVRLSAAAVMIHHGQEKILSPELFTKFTIDKYFGFLPGPHIFYAYAAGYVQFLAPIFLSLGVFSRLAGASLVAVMLGAVYYSLVNVGLEGFPFFELQGLGAKLKFGVPAFHNYSFETPVLYIAVFALAAVAGPGKFSLAQLLGWNDDKSLLGKLKQ